MKTLKSVALIATGALVLCVCPALHAQAAAAQAVVAQPVQPVISFQFERAGLPVPKFTIKVAENGAGTYQADVVPGVGSYDGAPMPVQATQHVSRDITLTAATVGEIFKDARALNHFNIECDSKAKNIANTGAKTLSYSGADGKGACTYNYSENKSVEALTNTFLSVAYTIDEGRRLAFLHRFDRLGLDAEMNGLVGEAKEGHAVEIGTIAPVLTSIAKDDQVMERVRLAAAKLLKETTQQ